MRIKREKAQGRGECIASQWWCRRSKKCEVSMGERCETVIQKHSL